MHRSASLIPIFLLAVLLLALGGTWWAMDSRDRAMFRVQDELLGQQTGIRLEEYLATRLALVNELRANWLSHGPPTRAEFEARVEGLQAVFRGFQALNWVDPDGVIRWIVPREGNELAENRDLRNHPVTGPTFSEAERSGSRRLTPPIELFQGGHGLAGYVPLLRDGVLEGYLNPVFRIETMVEDCLGRDFLDRFHLRITDGGDVVYQTPDVSFPESAAEALEWVLDVADRRWTLRFHPSGRAFGRGPLRPHDLPILVGLVLSIALAWITRVALLRQTRWRDSDRRLRALMGNLPDLVVLVDRTGRVLEVHGEPFRTDRKGAGSAERPELDALIAPDLAARVRDALGTPPSGDLPRSLDHRHGEGAEARFTEVRIVETSSDRALVIVTDVSRRRRAEDLMRLLSELVEGSDDLIGFGSMDGTLRYLNRAGRHLAGIGPTTTIEGLELSDLHEPDDEDRGADMMRRVRSGGIWHGRLRLRDLARGETIPVELRAFSMGTMRGHGTDLFGVVGRDLRERESLEAQLLHAQKMEAMGQMAGGLAHDFNNLLTAVGGYAELALHASDASDASPNVRRSLEEIQEAARRGSHLTGQLLTFSRKQILRPRTLDLNRLVSGMLGMLGRLVREDVEIVPQLADETIPIDGEPGALEQVVVNLVLNARDAMPDGGRIGIATGRHTDGGAYLEVTDTGHGMSEDVRNRIFEPFFTTKEAGRGTGLGLSMVYGIVTQAGGTIEVDSRPGKGARLQVRFPGSSGTIEEPDENDAEPIAAGNEGAKVLVVEDDDLVRDVAVRILRTAGFGVLEACNGDDALRLARRDGARIVDVLITDVVMPGIGGRVLAERLRALRPDVRILFVSGYTDANLQKDDLSRLDARFLAKPYTSRDLLWAVRECLAGPA